MECNDTRFPYFWKAVHILPLEMNDAVSDYEFLCSVCAKMNELISANENTQDGLKLTNTEFVKLKEELAEITSELEKIKTGQYNDFYVGLVKEYIKENLTDDFMKDKIKHICFGLTNDGHFAAYVTENYSFLHWDTIMNPHSPLFGHLCLQW